MTSPARRRLLTALRLRCPVCSRGDPFEGLFAVRHHCDLCGYRFEREPGYFLGSIYINYGVTAAIEICGFFLLEALLGLTFFQQTFVWVPFSVLFPLLFLRHARSLWMAFDHRISPPTEEDFTVRT